MKPVRTDKTPEAPGIQPEVSLSLQHSVFCLDIVRSTHVMCAVIICVHTESPPLGVSSVHLSDATGPYNLCQIEGVEVYKVSF